MTNVINLKQVRKEKARLAKAAKAKDNRVEFGRTKLEKKISEIEKKRGLKKFEDHKLDKDS